MNQAPKIIYDIWKSHDNYLGEESEQRHLVDISRIMANLFCPGKFYYYVIDSPTLTFDFVSNEVRDLLGVEPEDFSLKKLIGLVHPDDLHFAMKCEDIVAHFLKKHVPPHKMTKYKISYCLRERTKKGDYKLFLLQTITARVTEDGALLKVFGSHSDISHITTENNHKLSFIGLGGEPSYMEIDVFDKTVFGDYTPFHLEKLPTPTPFTKRELEIIRLLAAGDSTDEITQKLFISKHTAEAHRRNILKKADARNTPELIMKCFQQGYI